MRSRLSLVTAPTFEPVSVAEAKAWCRVDTSDDDTLFSSLITAVRTHVDGRHGWLNRALCTQTWDLYLDDFPASADGCIRVPLPPLQSITSVKYDDVNGDEQTISSANYNVDTVSEPGRLVPIDTYDWPDVYQDGINEVRIRFVAGWVGDGASPEASTTPEGLKHGILQAIADLYENRESVVIGPNASSVPITANARRLLRPYWIPGLA